MSKKIKLSAELKKKIAEVTGLTYLAYNLENYSVEEAAYVSQILNYYAPTPLQLTLVANELLPSIKTENPDFKPEGGGDVPGVEQFRFVIVAVPEGATILINGVEQAGVTVDAGTKVTWSVSAPDFVTQSGETIVESETTLEITLVAKEAPVMTSTMPATIDALVPTTFDLAIQPGAYDGEIAILKGSINSNQLVIEWLNPETSAYEQQVHDGQNNYIFGSVTGITLAALTQQYRVRTLGADQFEMHIDLVRVSDQQILTSLDIAFAATVVTPVKPKITKNVYQISNEAELRWFEENPMDLAGAITKDIDLRNVPFHPIEVMLGLDGKNHVISNVNINTYRKIDTSNNQNAQSGFIGHLAAGNVSNLTLRNINIDLQLGAKWVGGLIGHCDSLESTIQNCHVENATINCNSFLSYRIGGLIGFIGGNPGNAADTNVSIVGCSAKNVDIRGSYALAGLVGSIRKGAKTFTDCTVENFTLNQELVATIPSGNVADYIGYVGNLLGDIMVGADKPVTITNCVVPAADPTWYIDIAGTGNSITEYTDYYGRVDSGLITVA